MPIPSNGVLDQPEHLQRDLPVVDHPVLQIVQRFGLDLQPSSTLAPHRRRLLFHPSGSGELLDRSEFGSTLAAGARESCQQA